MQDVYNSHYIVEKDENFSKSELRIFYCWKIRKFFTSAKVNLYIFFFFFFIISGFQNNEVIKCNHMRSWTLKKKERVFSFFIVWGGVWWPLIWLITYKHIHINTYIFIIQHTRIVSLLTIRFVCRSFQVFLKITFI